MPGRRALARLLLLLDSESVRLYQAFIYGLYLLAGVWTAVTGLPGVVDVALGHGAGCMWVLALIGSPVLTFLGRDVERRAHTTPSRHLAAFILQLAGDCGVMLSSFTFAAALSSTIYAGRAVFAAWVIGGLGICAMAMMVRGVRKLLGRVGEARKVVRGE